MLKHLISLAFLLPAATLAQEAAPETAPEAAPEAAPETAPETAPEAAPETAPEPAPKAPPAEAALVILHGPVDSAPVDRALPITVEVDGAGHLASLTLRVRDGAGTWHSLPFERLDPRSFQATIPKAITAHTHLAYAIQSTDRAGSVRSHFATVEAPHHVDLYGRGEAAQSRDQLARYQGHRNALRLNAETVAFGGRRLSPDAEVGTDDYSDAWFDLNVEYIYRPLTRIHDIRFQAGFMRARLPEIDGVPALRGDSPGLNYGAAEVNFELHRWFSAGGRLILGANEEGFVIGAGAVARIGDLAATHLAADIETIGDVGFRSDIRFHWTTVPRFPMALGVTFTDWPDQRIEGSSTLLSYDVAIDLTEGSRLSARIGAANRPESLATGIMGGLGFQQSF